MTIILITPPSGGFTSISREISLLPQFFQAGLQTLHLRKPNATPEQLATYIDSVPAHYRNRLVVHHHHNLATQYRLKGIHYKDGQLPDGMLKAHPGLTSSCSFHSPLQLGTCRGELDYCFLSPIYDSISKKEYPSGFQDKEELREYVVTSRYPVVALGGVSVEKLEELADLGFSGAALLGSIWEAEDPLAALKASLAAAKEVQWESSFLSCNTL